MKEPKEGQIWNYQGPGTGRGVAHMIVSLEREWSDGLQWVITWSAPLQRKDIGGFTWKGPVNVFKREFARNLR